MKVKGKDLIPMMPPMTQHRGRHRGAGAQVGARKYEEGCSGGNRLSLDRVADLSLLREVKAEMQGRGKR